MMPSSESLAHPIVYKAAYDYTAEMELFLHASVSNIHVSYIELTQDNFYMMNSLAMCSMIQTEVEAKA